MYTITIKRGDVVIEELSADNMHAALYKSIARAKELGCDATITAEHDNAELEIRYVMESLNKSQEEGVTND